MMLLGVSTEQIFKKSTSLQSNRTEFQKIKTEMEVELTQFPTSNLTFIIVFPFGIIIIRLVHQYKLLSNANKRK